MSSPLGLPGSAVTSAPWSNLRAVLTRIGWAVPLLRCGGGAWKFGFPGTLRGQPQGEPIDESDTNDDKGGNKEPIGPPVEVRSTELTCLFRDYGREESVVLTSIINSLTIQQRSITGPHSANLKHISLSPLIHGDVDNLFDFQDLPELTQTSQSITAIDVCEAGEVEVVPQDIVWHDVEPS
jgi:hypothetical protein